MLINNLTSLSLADDDVLLIEDDEELIDNSTQMAPEAGGQEQEVSNAWKMMIVDDDAEVHQATKLALRSFTFEGKPLTFVSAYSGEEAKKLIAAHPDTAFVLLDVVMETHDTGLRVVQYIREELKNHIVRVILRTGQPGEAPEEAVILNYDINDYKLKVELTRQKLITTAITALRSYRDVITIEKQKTQLAQTLHNLKRTQLQLVQAEKISALGQLVAGVAHEVNNPVNFISGNLHYANQYVRDLINLLYLYQKSLPNPPTEIEKEIEQIDLEYLLDDLPQMISSMEVGIHRIRDIMQSLRNFSRVDGVEKRAADIHEGIDTTLMILQHRLQANSGRPAIKVIKEYGNLPLVECYPGQLNQVFMNLLANAIHALEESNHGKSYDELVQRPNIITIHTKVGCKQDGSSTQTVVISIADNGLGMAESVRSRVFDTFFTTKPEGKGTGLGLSISHQIITEKHGGTLQCFSNPEQGAEFVIHLPIH